MCDRGVSARRVRLNPVQLAREWCASMDERGESRADLARRLGVSRARVTQVLQVLDLDPAALELIERIARPAVVSERGLRALKNLPPEAQQEHAAQLFDPCADETEQRPHPIVQGACLLDSGEPTKERTV